jgi:hypothetical protein
MRRCLHTGGFGQDATVSASVRRRAARDVLELALQYRETADLEARVASLEEGLVNDRALALEEGFVEEKGATAAEAAGATN